MDFYTSIHQHYDHIFPLNTSQVNFVIHEITNPGSKLLDIGCSTGSMAFALAAKGFQLNAIDLDESMILLAKRKATGLNPQFDVLDMMEISRFFGEEKFDGIICFGNTLVHLTDNLKVENFIRMVYSQLQPGGKFLLQILNYEFILDEKITYLPLIENVKIKFVREYGYQQDGLIAFKTQLTNNETGQIIYNHVKLNPITKPDLHKSLIHAGFQNIEYHGSFNGDQLKPNSLPLIVRAER